MEYFKVPELPYLRREAYNFSKSRSLYRGGGLGIFLNSGVYIVEGTPSYLPHISSHFSHISSNSSIFSMFRHILSYFPHVSSFILYFLHIPHLFIHIFRILPLIVVSPIYGSKGGTQISGLLRLSPGRNFFKSHLLHLPTVIFKISLNSFKPNFLCGGGGGGDTRILDLSPG